jgi:2-iminobutanoate/2-iminopropanoate deaminase
MDFLFSINTLLNSFTENYFMKIFILSAVLTILTFSASAQDKTIAKEKWHGGIPEKQDTSAGYAQAVKAGNVLYISGTVARDVNEEGIKRVYSSLEKTLKEFGLSFQNVVKENLYTTDIEAMKKYNFVRKEFYKGDFPAATWVQIARLYLADARLEVELIAHFPEK